MITFVLVLSTFSSAEEKNPALSFLMRPSTYRIV
jgi:hypothetical protein